MLYSQKKQKRRIPKGFFYHSDSYKVGKANNSNLCCLLALL